MFDWNWIKKTKFKWKNWIKKTKFKCIKKL